MAQINQFTVTIFWNVHPNHTVFCHLKQFVLQDFHGDIRNSLNLCSYKSSSPVNLPLISGDNHLMGTSKVIVKMVNS